MPANAVKRQTKTKHEYLLRYIDICSATRKMWLGSDKAGATYIDLFCASGRSQIQENSEWVDGSAVAAWKKSLESDTPFTQMHISDIDEESLNACVSRLKELNAPVTGYLGKASDAAEIIAKKINPHGLHFAFVDPYNIETLDFKIIKSLAGLKRIDLLIHVSRMDLQRNLTANLGDAHSIFDSFAPDWRFHVDINGSQSVVRERVVDYWREKVKELGVWPSINQRLITGPTNQPLYWLLIAAKHKLAQTFWDTASNPEGQGKLF